MTNKEPKLQERRFTITERQAKLLKDAHTGVERAQEALGITVRAVLAGFEDLPADHQPPYLDTSSDPPCLVIQYHENGAGKNRSQPKDPRSIPSDGVGPTAGGKVMSPSS